MIATLFNYKEAIMSAEKNANLTEKQRYWLNHIQQAKASGQSLSDYAAEHALRLKALYQYRWLLRKKGMLDEISESPAFVKVTPPVVPVPQTKVTVHFPNGIRVELAGHGPALSALLMQVRSL
jgi:hypothetical protein